MALGASLAYPWKCVEDNVSWQGREEEDSWLVFRKRSEMIPGMARI